MLKKYSKARTLLQKLKSSILRQKAIEQMEVLAEAFVMKNERKRLFYFNPHKKLLTILKKEKADSSD